MFYEYKNPIGTNVYSMQPVSSKGSADQSSANEKWYFDLPDFQAVQDSNLVRVHRSPA